MQLAHTKSSTDAAILTSYERLEMYYYKHIEDFCRKKKYSFSFGFYTKEEKKEYAMCIRLKKGISGSDIVFTHEDLHTMPTKHMLEKIDRYFYAFELFIEEVENQLKI